MDFLFDQRPQRLTTAPLGLDRLHDLVGGGHADIGGDQRLFESLDGLEVDGARTPLRFVGALDHLVEAFDELLLGARQRLFDAIEKTHGYPSTSARWRRSISVSTASLGEHCPSRTACICDAIGSSMPCLAPSERAAGVVRTPSATIRVLLRISFQRPATAERHSDLAVAAQASGTCQHQVTEAAQSGQRVTASAFGKRKPRDLGKPAGDQRRERVLTQTQPLRHAGRNRDHVLQRAADLHAGDVVVDIQSESLATKVLLHRGRGLFVSGGGEDGGRQPSRGLERETRTG